MEGLHPGSSLKTYDSWMAASVCWKSLSGSSGGTSIFFFEHSARQATAKTSRDFFMHSSIEWTTQWNDLAECVFGCLRFQECFSKICASCLDGGPTHAGFLLATDANRTGRRTLVTVQKACEG